MEEVVVYARMGETCKRFVMKDNSICDRSALGFDGDGGKPHNFFDPENNAGGDMHDS